VNNGVVVLVKDDTSAVRSDMRGGSTLAPVLMVYNLVGKKYVDADSLFDFQVRVTWKGSVSA
jgi:hypothetical protein